MLLSKRLFKYLGGIPGLLINTLAGYPIFTIGWHVLSARWEMDRLRYETNHAAVLATSRQLMQKYPGQYIADAEHDPRVPLMIRQLGPSSISINTDRLKVELHGGFLHYGYVAIAAGVEPWGGENELIEGLYF